MVKFPLLYSLTSRGQTQTWQIETDGPKFRTIEGLFDGALTTSDWTVCEGKNIDKTNETTDVEQAQKEAAARHQKKLDSGYCLKSKDIYEPKFFEPLLAKQWEDYKDATIFPVLSSPKLDGLRMVVSKDGAFSRNGKSIVSVPHILKALGPLLAANPNLTLDGEIYCDKLKHDFNKIISLAKKTKPTENDLVESAFHLEYWVFDVVDDLRPELPFTERFKLLNFLDLTHPIYVVPHLWAMNEKQLDDLYEKYLDAGFEGQMVRVPSATYEHKRSKNLLKRKTFIDEEFELVDLESGRGGSANLAARAILKTKEGIQFEAGIIGSHEYAASLLNNKDKLIGKMSTVVYQNLTPEGKPRFAKLKIIDRESYE